MTEENTQNRETCKEIETKKRENFNLLNNKENYFKN